MLRRLMFLAVVVVVGALPFAPASPGARSDDPLCFGSPATHTGSGTIVGTDGDDVIVGSDGNDAIQGRNGNDKICGGAGDDALGGGPGDDQLDGGLGNDFVQGGPGNDAILGGEGDDTVQGGADTDTCDGGAGTNTAITTGFEACETVTNASPPATPPVEKTIPLRATLTVGREVPHPKGTRGATGLFSATLTPTGDGATIVWRLTYKKLTGPAVATHIHSGKPGQAGPVLVALCGPCAPGAHGTVQVTGQPARRTIVSGEAYVNVHTMRNPGGEIRGQFAKQGG